MRAISVSKSGANSSQVLIRLSLTFVLLFSGVSVVYAVGLEPMLYLHDAFHDVRHATGFPCH